MKYMPHILGGLFCAVAMIWVGDVIENFAVAQKVGNAHYAITATGWSTIMAVWPVFVAVAVICGGIGFFAGLFLGESWVAREFRNKVIEIIAEVEAERIMVKSKNNSLLGRQKEIEDELRAAKYQVRRCLQKIKEREKALEEREKKLATLEKELSVTKATNDRLFQKLTSMLKPEC